ncbi:unnamed protein product [Closterium sp. NIES-53]
MSVKEALASWKGKAVNATMKEEIRSLINMNDDSPVDVDVDPQPHQHHEEPVGVDDEVPHRRYRPAREGDAGRYLDGVLLGAGWKKSQVDTALYFKVDVDGMACWVLVYVNDLLAASSSAEMLKELKGLLEAAFELREILSVQKYLGLEIVHDRPARKLWLHQQGYADKLRRRFLDEEQTRRTPKTPASVDAYAKLTFDNEEAQEHQEEEYR